MFERLHALFHRYETAHLTETLPGRYISDHDGLNIGYVDQIVLCAGCLQVRGWAQAAKVRLVLGGAEAEMAPLLRRPDVASALKTPETVGFDLSVPASLYDLDNSAPPGLVVVRDAGQSLVNPISLVVQISALRRLRIKLAFAWDAALSLPAILGWILTRDPAFRTSVKNQLGLELLPVSGLLEPGLFRDPSDPPELAIPQDRITVVLPVYNAFDLLKLCLDRVERHTDLPWRLILVEDGSTDVRILPFLREWSATRNNVELLENSENCGFVASVNRGLEKALARNGDGEGSVILLNSDALVPKGWASRLVRPFYQHENVATVTPMSNDAEIFSVPQICARTMLKPGQGDAIDRVASSFAPEAFLSVAPTGVGFCMAMGRDWLAQQPALDTAFGRGYGEEVDWCQKVSQRGGRHLCLPGLFVEHRGGESFGSAEKRSLVAKNNMIVSYRYPAYDRQVQDFIAVDPLLTARLALALAWAGSLNPEAPVPVYMAHALGGGANYWLEHRMAEDLEKGHPSVVLRVGGRRRFQLEVISSQGRCLGQTDDPAVMISLLSVLPKRRVVYSCGVGDPDPVALPKLLCDLLRDGDLAEMLFHDFFPFSPSYTLLDSDMVYRGPVMTPRNDPAHTTRRLDGTAVSLADWQAAWKAFADRAELVVFSKDSAAQVSVVWPDLQEQIVVRPHRLDHEIGRLPTPAFRAIKVLGVLGNIGAHKGAGLVRDLGWRLDRDKNKKIRLVLIGNIDPIYALPASTTLHGSYVVKDLPRLARSYGITHWLIPSIWPETFCYTVHEALCTGLPVMAFALGAQGDAVGEAKNGVQLPFDPEADLVKTVLEALDSAAAECSEESNLA